MWANKGTLVSLQVHVREGLAVSTKASVIGGLIALRDRFQSVPEPIAVDLWDPRRGRDETQGILPVLTSFRSTFGFAALVRCAVASRPGLSRTHQKRAPRAEMGSDQ